MIKTCICCIISILLRLVCCIISIQNEKTSYNSSNWRKYHPVINYLFNIRNYGIHDKTAKLLYMNELELIKITQYSFAILGKGLPKGCVLKGGESDHIVEFYKYDRDDLWNEYGRPVGFYFKDEHRYELRSKYDGHELIGFIGKELDDVVNCL